MSRAQNERDERRALDRHHDQFVQSRGQRALDRQAFWRWLDAESRRLGRKLTAEEIAAFERGQR